MRRLKEERQLFYLFFFLVVFSPLFLECLKVCKERAKCARSCFCSGKGGHGVGGKDGSRGKKEIGCEIKKPGYDDVVVVVREWL